MLILGIDPGAQCGYAFLSCENGNVKLKEYGVIPLKSKEYHDRFLLLAATLSQMIENKVNQIAAIALEDGFYGIGRGKFQLSEMRGMVKTLAWYYGLDCFAYSPTHIKKIIGLKGNAKKHEVQAKICQRFFLTDIQEDAADAIAIALAYWENFKKSRK